MSKAVRLGMSRRYRTNHERSSDEMANETVRYHVEFEVEGDISLMMHHLLTLGEQHWKIIGGTDGVKIEKKEGISAKVRIKDKIDRLKQQSMDAMRSGRVAEAVRLYNQAWEMERKSRQQD